MLNHIKNKMVIIDHIEIFFWKNLENSRIYGIFRSQGKKMKLFWECSFWIKNPYISVKSEWMEL